MEPKFIHLRIQSSYSLLESALTIDALAEEAVSSTMPAMGITDRDNLFGALEFSEALAHKGVQPIIGATLHLIWNAEDEIGGDIALYAKNDEGYRNLLALVSHAHLHGGKAGKVGITPAVLQTHAAGLICLTGGRNGIIDSVLAMQQTRQSKEIFSLLNNTFTDNLYVELQRYSNVTDPEIEAALLDFAYTNDVPLVATNQTLFASPDDYNAHDALICIADSTYVTTQERRHYTPDHCLKSAQEMCTLFADLPEALENTIEIAKRCAYRPMTAPPMLPNFGVADEAAELRAQAKAGLAERLKTTPITKAEQDYYDRLDFELDVINNMGFAGYFLIVADFIQWAKRQSIAVGPGRGSGAGSVVAWALTITDLDPLRFNLLFERFLNPERVSMPDFDIDFCQSRRDEVIRYVQERYGADKVAQIITFGKLQARAVLRDVGRVLQLPYNQVDRICKMIPNNPAAPSTLAQALASEPRLREEQEGDEQVRQMMDISLKLEGLYRHASTHAAGVVIADRPLHELIPLYSDPKSEMAVTQFNMKWVEKAGLVKFDFLGLKTLTVIERTLELLPEADRPDMLALPFDDAKTFALLRDGDTIGVFQLEGSGMRDALRNMQVDGFEDIIALVSLYRPGPMENIPLYNSVKRGDVEPDYLHPTLEPLLKETYGVIIYQEQVMQIAQTLSGYSLGEADLLRRAMGKKDQSGMDAQKARFIEGAIANGVEKRKASDIYDLVKKFAGYGFNKSHAAAYALIAYQTAYLKANFPLAFYAASMTLDYERTEKLNVFRQDAARAGRDIRLASPDVNRSLVRFGVKEDEITYALSAIRNVGSGSMEMLVEERETNGKYKSLIDFVQRIGGIGLNRRLLENLIKAGALDSLEPNRAKLLNGIEHLLGEAGASQYERETQQENMFNGEGGEQNELHLPDTPAWATTLRLNYEFEAIGFFLSGHPLDEYKTLLDRNHVIMSDKLAQQTSKKILMAGAVIKKQERKSKRGNAFAFVSLSDEGGQFEITIFSEVLSQSREILEEGNLVVVGVDIDTSESINGQEGSLRLTASSVRSIDRLSENNETGLRIFVSNRDTQIYKTIKSQLDEGRITDSKKKGGMVHITIQGNVAGDVELELPDRYNINPRITGALKSIPGIHVETV
ncbi:MAG: DNA polymerase III subunit alpha [Alphaproteobacteria bacterium]|nr:DNA polymerase III subunit alpha [Alphaproteobacteria bacterium]